MRDGGPPSAFTRRASLATLATLAAAPVLAGNVHGVAGAPADAGATVVPERFMLGSDAGHGIAFQRMIDWLEARDLVSVALPSALYDISDTPLTISTALQIHGAGFLESGRERAIWGGGPSERMIGTRIRANCRSAPAITITGGAARGALIDGIAFEQDHPAPAPGWAPIDYQDIIAVRSTRGAVGFGRVAFLGVNRIASFVDCGRVSIGALTGQAFRRGLFFDDCRDIVHIDHIDLWDFWSSDRAVRTFMQSNLEALVLGRVDGIEVGMMFSLWGNIGLRLVETASGVPTSAHFDYFWADGTRTGLLSEAPNAEAYFDYFRAQSEASDGIALMESCLVRFSATAGGGIYDFGRLSGDFFALNAIRNESNSAVTVYRPGKFLHYGGAKALWHSPVTPLHFVQREIHDTSGPAGSEDELTRSLTTRDQITAGPFADDAAASRAGIGPNGAYRRADGLMAWRRD